MDKNTIRKLASPSKLISRDKKLDINKKLKRFCVNCRNHNVRAPITNHKKLCKYQNCNCQYCELSNYVKKVSLKERKVHKEVEREIEKTHSIQHLIEKIDDEQSKIDSEQTDVKTFCEISSNDDILHDVTDIFKDVNDVLNDVDDILPMSFPATVSNISPADNDDSNIYDLDSIQPFENREDTWIQYLNILND